MVVAGTALTDGGGTDAMSLARFITQRNSTNQYHTARNPARHSAHACQPKPSPAVSRSLAPAGRARRAPRAFRYMPRTCTLPFARRSTPARASTGPTALGCRGLPFLATWARAVLERDAAGPSVPSRRHRHRPQRLPAVALRPPGCFLFRPSLSLNLMISWLYIQYFFAERDTPTYRYSNGMTNHKAS
jgi:hypothetical protein